MSIPRPQPKTPRRPQPKAVPDAARNAAPVRKPAPVRVDSAALEREVTREYAYLPLAIVLARRSGNPEVAGQAAAALVRDGVGAVLATLGSKGAVLVTGNGSWHGRGPAIEAKSTVGAGDSALSGYLLATLRGDTPEACLQQAVAHGAAAASLPGTMVPSLAQTNPTAVTVTALASVEEF